MYTALTKIFKQVFKQSEKLIKLYKKNKPAFLITLFLLLATCYYNKDLVIEYLGFGFGSDSKSNSKSVSVSKTKSKSNTKQKSYLEIYIEKSILIENECRKISEHFNSDNVTTWVIHNGTVATRGLHLMKADKISTYNKDYNHIERYWVDMPLYPYARYINLSLQNGYHFCENTKDSKDVVMRDVFKETNQFSVIYIPLFDTKEMVGFVSIGYSTQHKFTKKEVKDMIRFCDLIEAHLQL